MSQSIPAYLTLVHDLLVLCTEMGVTPVRANTASTLPENSGYVFLRFGSDQAAALIIPKATAQVKRCDSHVDVPASAGGFELSKPNGRVLCHVDASQADWRAIVNLLYGADKRPVSRASKGASAPASVMADFQAKLATLGMPKAQAPVAPAMPEPVASEDEEGEFLADA